MNNIHLFSKISAIFFALVFITTPIASALTTGYILNDEKHADDHDKTYEYVEYIKYAGLGSYSKDSTEIDSSKNNAKDNTPTRPALSF